MDLLPLYSDIQCVTAVPHITRRHQIATPAAHAISSMHGSDAKEAFAARITMRESPEKWALYHWDCDRKKFENDEAVTIESLVG